MPPEEANSRNPNFLKKTLIEHRFTYKLNYLNIF